MINISYLAFYNTSYDGSHMALIPGHSVIACSNVDVEPLPEEVFKPMDGFAEHVNELFMEICSFQTGR